MGLVASRALRIMLIYCAAGQLGCDGTVVSRAAWTRRQSSPSNSAESCAAVRCMTPSCDVRPAECAVLKPLGEQAHAGAVPEDQLHPVRPLGAEHVDGAGERIGPSVSRTSAARPSAPLRKSTGLVATITRTAPVGPITRRPSRRAAPPRPSSPRHRGRPEPSRRRSRPR